ncbi:MAG TPA: hypothetical protein VGR31_16920 [Planctomycetota bacterium]|jgi:hypothetical protein|nr:hypothetical protein [Planctomycetota bacterium]
MSRADEKPTRRADRLALALCAFHALVRWVPWAPKPVGVDIDASWSWVFHEVWSRPLVCGRDVVFTYGPYGFLLTESYHPATFAVRIAVFAAVSLLLVSVLWRIVRARTSSPLLALAWTILLVESMAVGSAQANLFLHLEFLLVALAWTLAQERTGRILLHLLVVTAAVGALAKFTLLLGALVAVVAVVVRRRAPSLLATFGAAFLAAWWIAGQPLAALPSYLSTSVEISAGYAESMGRAAPAAQILGFLACAAVAGWLFARAIGGAGLALAALLFLVFKAAFVRYDAPHAVQGESALLLLLAGSQIQHPTRPRRLLPSVAAVAAIAGVFALTSALAASPWSASWPEEIEAAAEVCTGRAHLRARHEAALAAIRSDAPLPPLAGTVDLVPARVGLVLAADLAYAPRPVIQSYCAFSPRLLQLNAEHLAGDAAPAHVLFTIVDAIDGRLPAMDDSLCLPVLLARYDITGAAGEHLVLALRERARPMHLEPIATRRVRFGETFFIDPVASGVGIWAELHVEPTLRGRAAGFLYRPPVLRLAVRLADGSVGSFRLVPGIARAGFLLGPLLQDDDEYRRFAAGAADLSTRDVRSISVSGAASGAGVDWAYGPDFELRLAAFRLER